MSVSIPSLPQTTGNFLSQPNAPPTQLDRDRQTMHAVVKESGRIRPRLAWREVPIPRRSHHQVLIAVEASSFQPWIFDPDGDESIMQRWRYPRRLLGCDVAGKVLECHENSFLRPGDRVMGFLKPEMQGAWAEFCVCDENTVIKIPDSMQTHEAAALPLAGTFALEGLRKHGTIGPGTRVLVNGADSMTGLIAVQLAKFFGAFVMAVGCEASQALCRQLGADDFCDGNRQNYTWMNSRYDLIFDAAGTSSFCDVLDILHARGRFVTVDPKPDGFAMLILNWVSGKTGFRLSAEPDHHVLQDLLNLYGRGQLVIPIGQRIAMKDIDIEIQGVSQVKPPGAIIMTPGATVIVNG